MTSTPRRARHRLFLTLIFALAIMASPWLSPAGNVLAQSALYPGAVGLVANTGGDPVLLRESPSFDAAVLSSYWEGTPVDILEGPVYSDDGTAWHGVSIGGVVGYVVAGYLVESGQAAAPVAEPVEMAQEAVPAEAMTAEAAPVAAQPAADLAGLPANPVPTANLNLRAGPSYDDAVLLVVPAGAALTPTGEQSDGFVGVTYQGQYGWVDASWLAPGGAAPQEQGVALMQEAAPAVVTETAPVADAGVIGDLAAPAGDMAYTAGVVNLRLGPAETDDVLRVLPAAAAVTITGAASNGWTPVWYNGTWGFISSDLLTFDGSQSLALFQEAAPVADPLIAADPAATSGSGELLATTLSDVNLRAAPDVSSAVLGAIPPGVSLPALAGPEQGYYQVEHAGQVGWVSAEFVEVSASYLQRGDREARQDEGKVEGSAPAENAELGAGGVIWPVTGGTWYIMQGYHGSSHQNQDSLWQYEYSLDLARRDGDTAGQPVISPVNGVVRWTDPGTGGISIDIGNGHAVAMFHVDFMRGLEAGTQVRQGQHLGQISGPGGPGFAGTPHLHFTLWASEDNGNWDRRAVPFTGPYAISGMDFPDGGGGNTYRGTEFNP